MIESIVRFSVRQKLLTGMWVAGLLIWGVYSMLQLPIDAVPDITNNQVQIVSSSASLAPQEVEQFITYPVEVAMANLPDVVEIRSISRFGLSVVTVVFDDQVPMMLARQYVTEQIEIARQSIPEGLANPELMPITSGLGEIYQYVLEPEPGYEDQYGPMELRTLQDWIVKRQLAGIPGIIEVSSFGGFLKQYEVALDPIRMQAAGVTLSEVFSALQSNNENTGGSYIEQANYAYYIRAEGLVQDLEDIRNIGIKVRRGVPVLIKDVGTVGFGHPKRYGAMTMDGKGETVGGITLMLKGANSSEAIQNVHERVEEVRQSLPKGVRLEPYLDRSDLVSSTISTVRNNLVEGGLIVVLVLIVLLGNWRAGLIVASIIPLAMLFAIILMKQLGISANLISLGAIDFGIVVDGAVIVVEGALHALVAAYAGREITRAQLDDLVIRSTTRLFRSAFFGLLIILVVFVPIITLTGIEGKMFRPMALTFSFVILGALFLSLTYVPMISTLVLSRKVSDKPNWSDRLMDAFRIAYEPFLRFSLRNPVPVVLFALLLLGTGIWGFRRLGAEFLPTLEEGDLAMQMTISPGSSLEESVAMTTKAERLLLEHFPEVQKVVSKIGTAEVPTDPMAIEDADIMIILDEKENWTSAPDREGLVEKMKAVLQQVLGAEFEFTQPIQLRFNELLSGSKADVAVKIFGEDRETLRRLGAEAATLIESIPGAADVRLEQTEGRQELLVSYDRQNIARYGLDIGQLNAILRASFAGEVCGSVFEAERRFDLVVRLAEPWRQEVDLSRVYVPVADGEAIPMSALASVRSTEGPIQISRENARRRISVGINVRERDLESVVTDVQQKLASDLDLPPGYSIRYGGDFQNLQEARRRLAVAVPIALLLIFLFLYFAFGRLSDAVLILSAVPLAAVGGIAALAIRGLPFSISAGVGFIALFGVAVLNGIVLISYFNQLREKSPDMSLSEVIVQGSKVRLRPVLTTAAVAAFGFLPMATSVSNGAEVQRPLATVVIGGLISATLLTLVVLPVLYQWRARMIRRPGSPSALLVLFLGLCWLPLRAQEAPVYGLEELVRITEQQHPEVLKKALSVDIALEEQEAARFLPPINLNVELGAVNEPQFDYRFSAVQPFNPLHLNRERRLLGESRTEQAEAELALSRGQLGYQVREAWQYWLYTRAMQRLAEEQRDNFERLVALARDRFEAGAINRVEFDLTQVKLDRLDQLLSEARLQAGSARENLLKLAGLSYEAELRVDSLVPLAISPDTTRGNLLLLPAEKGIEVAQQRVEVGKANLKPSFSVGYFIQSIRPIYGLQGGLLGIQIPLARAAGKSLVEQARLKQLQADQELELQRRELEQARSVARRTVQEWESQLSDLQARRTQRQRLRELAAQQLASGAIDFFVYYQALEESLRAETQFLQVIYQFNRAVLQQEWFNQ